MHPSAKHEKGVFQYLEGLPKKLKEMVHLSVLQMDVEKAISFVEDTVNQLERAGGSFRDSPNSVDAKVTQPKPRHPEPRVARPVMVVSDSSEGNYEKNTKKEVSFDIRCFRCEKVGHTRANCTATGVECHYCCKLGHMKYACPSLRKEKETFPPTHAHPGRRK